MQRRLINFFRRKTAGKRHPEPSLISPPEDWGGSREFSDLFLEAEKRASVKHNRSAIPSPVTIDALLSHLDPEKFRPAQIRKALDPIVGQKEAKDYLSMLFAMHLLRVRSRLDEQRALPSAVLVGPTGVGKTHTIRTLSRIFGLPFVAVDSTTLVEAGIVGNHPEQIMELLLGEAKSIIEEKDLSSSQKAQHELANRGIVFFDEFDKLKYSPENPRDGSGRTIQRRLLKLIEGDLVRVGLKTGSQLNQKDIFINTANLLIIVGGAFEGIDSNEIRAQRRGGRQSQSQFDENQVTTEDIKNYGFMPELVARLPIIVPFSALSSNELEMILMHEEVSPLEIWRHALSALGMELEVDNEAIPLLAQQAIRLNMGARGLQQLVFPLLAEKTLRADAEGRSRVRLTARDISPGSRLSQLRPVVDDSATISNDGEEQ